MTKQANALYDYGKLKKGETYRVIEEYKGNYHTPEPMVCVEFTDGNRAIYYSYRFEIKG